MAQYKVIERFISINGEGTKAGQLAVFIRFQGCNLNCSYCDTSWANKEDAAYELMDEKEIYAYIIQSGIKNVTLTGGEPLMQNKICDLLELLSADQGIDVEIETNGSIEIKEYDNMYNRPAMTMDYKLPSSGMQSHMCMENLFYMRQKDTVKFVCGDMKDLRTAYQVIRENKLTTRCHVYLSPVYGQIDMQEMVEVMKEQRMNGVNLQLQMHKFIWEPNERGV